MMFIIVLAEGSGRSKKKAKQSAAEAFIYSLIYKVISIPILNPELPHQKHQREVNIDRLRSWKMENPLYRLEMEIGSQTKQYFVSCVLHDRKTFGSAGKLKAAKQSAAQEMWEEVYNDMR